MLEAESISRAVQILSVFSYRFFQPFEADTFSLSIAERIRFKFNALHDSVDRRQGGEAANDGWRQSVLAAGDQ